MTVFNKISEFFSKKPRFLIVSGIAAAGLFVLGWHFLLKYAGRTDLIPVLDTQLKNTFVFALIMFMFLVALGEFVSHCGKFSFVSYAVTTFFAALACYVITPPAEVFTALDLSDPAYVVDSLNKSYSVWWIVYLIVYACALLFGLLVNRKNVFTVKNA